MIALAGLLAFLGLASAAPALATTYHVTNLDDANGGSLRQAVIDAESDPAPPAIIEFAPGLHGVLNLTGGPLTITKSMTIEGPGAGVLDVDGDGSQIIQIPSASATVSISGLEFSAGHVTTPDGSPAAGGAIDNSGTLSVNEVLFDHNSAGTAADPTDYSGTGSGGAIFNGGTLTVSDSTFTQNTAGGAGGNGFASSQGNGGAIASTGSLTVTGSTFTGNTAGGSGGVGGQGGAGAGGAVAAFGPVTLTDDTVTGNTAGGAAGTGLGSGLSFGGGLYVESNSTTTLRSDTIDGNTVGSAPGSNGAGIANRGTVSVIDTIVSGNHGAANCTNNVEATAGTMSASASLEGPAGKTSCGFNLRSADPLLGPLADNGGPTETQALKAGSPAIGAVASAADCPAADQRGAGRPRGGCDVGAYEVVPPVLGPASASSLGMTTASLSATVSNPDVFAGTVSFEYGASTAYGAVTSSQPLLAGASGRSFGASLARLSPGTLYHFRVVARNPDGTTFGPDQQFTTTSSPSLVPSPVASPSNAFRFGTAKVAPGGAITLGVNAPDAGRFAAKATFTVITRKGHKRLTTTFTYGTASVRNTGRGAFKLVIGLRGRAARELKLLRSRQVTVLVTFTPTGGTAHHATKKVTVKRSRKGKYS